MAERRIVWRGLETAAAGLRTAPGPVYLGLLAAPSDVTTDTVVGDLLQPSFDGYAPQVVPVWTSAHLVPPDVDDDAVIDTSTMVVFTALGLADSVVIYGLFLLDAEGGLLLVDQLDGLWPQTIPPGDWEVNVTVQVGTINFQGIAPPPAPEPPAGYDLWTRREELEVIGVGNSVERWYDQSGDMHDFADTDDTDPLVVESDMGSQLFAQFSGGYLAQEDDVAGNFGAGEFTVHVVLRNVGFAGIGVLLSKDPGPGVDNGIIVYQNGANLVYYNGASNYTILSLGITGTFLLTIIRRGLGADEVEFYQNGALSGLATDGRTLTNTYPLTLGAHAGGGTPGDFLVEEYLSYPSAQAGGDLSDAFAYFASKYQL